MRRDFDSSQKDRLINKALKKKVLRNIVDVKVPDTKDFNTPIKYLLNKNVKDLFMEMKENYGVKMIITMKKS